MRNSLLALTLLVGAVSPATAAVIVQHPTQASLRSSLSSIQVENFDDFTLLDGLSITGTATGTINASILYRLVRADRPSIFSFAEPIFGFGGDIRASGFGELDITLTFIDGTQQMLDAYSITPAMGFLGFSSDVGIRSIDIRSGTAGAVQYYLEDLTFGTATAAVPEPAQWAMLIVGFGMIGSAMRRRKQQVHLA